MNETQEKQENSNPWKTVDSRNGYITWTYFGIMIGVMMGVWVQLPAHEPWYHKFPVAFLMAFLWPIWVGIHLAAVMK